MMSAIIDGIAEAIYGEFGEEYPVYAEGVAQALETPCFSIMALDTKKELYLGCRYLCQNPMLVQYFPSGDSPIDECHKVRERLFACLAMIDVDSYAVRGTKMDAKLVDGVIMRGQSSGMVMDGVLQFGVNYDFFIYQTATHELMQDCNIKSEIKEK